jgi:AcrR family transcriptional regulator
LELFDAQGYEATGTAQVAAVAGVSEMTLFRHFPTKASLVLDDPFDPVMAVAVRDRPAAEPPMTAVVEGVRRAWRGIGPDEVAALRARLRVVAAAPSLQAAMRGSGQATVEALAGVVQERGEGRVEAQAVATAVVAGLGAALLEWSRTESTTLDEVVSQALDAMVGRSGC